MARRRTKKREAGRRHSKTYRSLKASGRTLIKATPHHLELLDAVVAFARSSQAGSHPTIRRDLEAVRTDQPGWAHDKALLARIVTALVDEWIDRWRTNRQT